MEKKDKKKMYKGPVSVIGQKLEMAQAAIAMKRATAAKNAAGAVTFAYFATHDEVFGAACNKAGIPATARQASKWARKRGLAWQNR